MTLVVALGADHGGLSLKTDLIPWLESQGHRVVDVGAYSLDPADDYPDFAEAVTPAVTSDQVERGILVCGSGVGACIAANKVPGIRACLCHDIYSAHQGVEHDNMNILCLGLQPDEGIHLKFGVKVPDQGMTTRSEDMEFHYESAFKDQPIPEAYERLLQDALEGDASLFIWSDHIEEAWRIVDPLLEEAENPDAPPPPIYEPGSWAPEAANGLLSQSGHRWQRVCGCHGASDG